MKDFEGRKGFDGGINGHRHPGSGSLILGTGKANDLAGSARSDVLLGLGGNDTITGECGNDLILGGGGKDTAVYQGSLDDYDITLTGTKGAIVKSLVTHEGTDSFTSTVDDGKGGTDTATVTVTITGPYAASDHDPLIIGLALGDDPIA